MLIEKIDGTIEAEEYRGLSIDQVEIEWYESQKKIHRLTSQKGRDVAIRLSAAGQNRGLRSGDVLTVVDNEALIIGIRPCSALLIPFMEQAKMITLCYEIGNRHVPFYYVPGGNAFALPYEQPLERLLEKLQISFQRAEICLDGRWKISSSTGHGHIHTEVEKAHVG